MDDWDTGMDDDEAGAVMRAVARQVKLWREAAGLTQAEFGAAIGYGEELVSSVERGRRIPRPEFLDRADEALDAGGKLAALKTDVAEIRYPKKVRDLKKMEAESVELCAYNNSVIHGLLQTEEYARAVISNRQPPSRRTRWSGAWLVVSTGRGSSAPRRGCRSSTSYSAKRPYDGAPGAQWCCAVSSNGCWRSGSCRTYRSRCCP